MLLPQNTVAMVHLDCVSDGNGSKRMSKLKTPASAACHFAFSCIICFIRLFVRQFSSLRELLRSAQPCPGSSWPWQPLLRVPLWRQGGLTAHVSLRPQHGTTLLMVASYAGHIDCVKELVLQGADINLQREVGQAGTWIIVMLVTELWSLHSSELLRRTIESFETWIQANSGI